MVEFARVFFLDRNATSRLYQSRTLVPAQHSRKTPGHKQNSAPLYSHRTTRKTENALEENEERGCTGSSAQFWDPKNGEWRSTFETIDGESHDLDMFYMSLVDGVNELWVTEIESWMAPSLYNQLQHNYVKLILTCPEDNVVVDSCVIFEPT